ncbi:MAG TPA: response regulator [Thermoanaerobaculaceae bacterium]|nr:response regulator [Thermoanaerobaculaceae bacterium]HRS17644.1 response regulator [Thermoanaerobaculaceae bacterium]
MVRRILVVEDERKLAELVKAFLTDKGFAVVVAHDGEKGVEIALREKPAVVLSDVLLPKLNGWDLCRRIKAEPALAATKVILMTAVYTKARYRTEALEAGADDFVAKPLDLEDLAVRIGRMFHLDTPSAAVLKQGPGAAEATVTSEPQAPLPRPEPPSEPARVAAPTASASPEPRPGRAAASAAPPVEPPPRTASPAPASSPRPAAEPPRPEVPQPPRARLDVEAALAGLAPKKPRPVSPPAHSTPATAASNGDFDAHLAALRRRFAASLPGTLSRIERAWVAAAGGCETGPWEELAHEAHDLAGSAGSFGLPAVGDAARELEEAVRTQLASGAPVSGKARAAIKQYVERLGALIHLL